MPATASFDITSTIDFQEVDNALNQARKEVAQRYDFKGAKADATISETDKTLTLVTDDDLEIPLEAQGISIFGANHCDGDRGAERLIAQEWMPLLAVGNAGERRGRHQRIQQPQ